MLKYYLLFEIFGLDFEQFPFTITHLPQRLLLFLYFVLSLSKVRLSTSLNFNSIFESFNSTKFD